MSLKSILTNIASQCINLILISIYHPFIKYYCIKSRVCITYLLQLKPKERVTPEVVAQADGIYSITYAPVTALLVEAMKEQNNIITEQEERISSLEDELAELKSTIMQHK